MGKRLVKVTAKVGLGRGCVGDMKMKEKDGQRKETRREVADVLNKLMFFTIFSQL